MKGLITALIVVAACCVPAHAAPPHKLAPPIPCTSKNRMDFFIDEDDIMYECQCQALKTIHVCHWQVIGGVDKVELRRKHHAVTIPAISIKVPA
jgi:hypothetical protein